MIFGEEEEITNALVDNPSEEVLKERLMAMVGKGSPKTQPDTSEEDKGILLLQRKCNRWTQK